MIDARYVMPGKRFISASGVEGRYVPPAFGPRSVYARRVETREQGYWVR
jgi:hypothetical protein